ncbi:MAG: alpha/beta fold hydrolase [Verrucomicrobiota bacterium]
MRNPSPAASLLALSALVLLSTSCSVGVKVREKWNDDLTRPLPLSDASRTWATLQQGRTPSVDQLENYNRVVRGAVVQIAANLQNESENLTVIQTDTGPVEIDVVSTGVDRLDLIDRAVPAEFVRIKDDDYFRSTVEIEGIGSSILVRQRPTSEDYLIPENGLWYPLTAVLELERQKPTLVLVDPTRDPVMRAGPREFPLSANYTAAFARDFQDPQLVFFDLPALLRFEQFKDRLGVRRISRFDPKKQAVILAHGLYSSPETWNQTLNELYAIPEIRERYEFWSFGYPSGAPIPYLALKFRENLREMLAWRRANGAEIDSIVVVGHSMGGLLAKSVTSRSGRDNWDRLFNVPPDDLDVSNESRQLIRDLVIFEPVDEIERVIFVATPHRGSSLADKRVVQLLSEVVQLPKTLLTASQEVVRESRHALTPLGLELVRESPSSLAQLTASTRYTEGFFDTPLNPNVVYHSIIGKKQGPEVPLEESTDNVVAYTSASIDGVASETVIEDSKHGVHQTEGGIAEIARILGAPRPDRITVALPLVMPEEE